MAKNAHRRGNKSEIELARQACLYGEGDGKPVMNVKRLCEIAGVHESTIWRHMPKWQKEREEILASANNSSLGIHLSGKELEAHKADMAVLRKEINQVKWELDTFDDNVEKLEALVERLTDVASGDPQAVGQVLQMFDKYLRFSLNKQNLRKQFLALQKQWTGLSGVEGLMDVALVREREMEKGRVKIALKKEGVEAEPRVVGPANTGVFVKRNAQEAIPLENVRDSEEDE